MSDSRQAASSQQHEPPLVKSDRKALTAWLEHVSLLFHTVIKSGDFEHTSPEGLVVRQHIAADYKAYWDVISEGLTFDQANAILKERAKNEPRMEFRVTSMSTKIDMQKGRASVYTQFILLGWMNSDDTELKGFDELSWRLRKDGQWMISQYQALRTGGFET